MKHNRANDDKAVKEVVQQRNSLTTKYLWVAIQAF